MISSAVFSHFSSKNFVNFTKINKMVIMPIISHLKMRLEKLNHVCFLNVQLYLLLTLFSHMIIIWNNNNHTPQEMRAKKRTLSYFLLHI